MKPISPKICLLFVTAGLVACTQPVAHEPKFANCEPNATACERHSPNTLIIFFDAETGNQPLLTAIQTYRAELLYEYRSMNGVAIKIPSGQSLEQAIAYFEKVKGVLAVNRDRILRLD